MIRRRRKVVWKGTMAMTDCNCSYGASRIAFGLVCALALTASAEAVLGGPVPSTKPKAIWNPSEALLFEVTEP